MKLTDFLGGLSTRLAPHLIDVNQSVICNNVDMTKGDLRPLKGLAPRMGIIPLSESHFVTYKGGFVSGDVGTHFVEFNDTLYKSSTSGVISKTTNGRNWTKLGLIPPVTELTVKTEEVNFTYSTINSGDDSDIPIGKHKYIIGYKTNLGKSFKQEITVDYTGRKGIAFHHEIGKVLSYSVFRQYEGSYYLVGDADVAGNVADKLYNISKHAVYNEFGYSGTKDVRSYVYTYYSSTTYIESAPSRVSAEIDVELQYVEVDGFTAPTDATVDAIKLYRNGGTLIDYYLVDTLSIENIGTKNYIDTKTDMEVLEGTLLETKDYIQPPKGLKFLTEWNSTLWAVDNDAKLWFSEVGLVDNWKSTNWIQFAESITGLGATQNGLLIFSRNRTWILAGDSATSYFKTLLNGSQGCITHNTVGYVDNNLVWLSLDGICISNGSAIQIASYKNLGKMNVEPVTSAVYDSKYFLFTDETCYVADFREGLKFYTIDILARGAHYSSYYDAFYVLLKGNLGVHEYDKATASALNYHYKSGWLHEGTLTNYKAYKNIDVYSEGDNTISIYVDGELAINQSKLNTPYDCVKLPQDKTRGYYIEIELKGTGIIKELLYNVEGKQNG